MLEVKISVNLTADPSLVSVLELFTSKRSPVPEVKVAKVEVNTKEVVVEAALPEVDAKATPTEAVVESVPQPKLEEVRTFLGILLRKGKKQEVQALFKQFGAEALKEVPGDKLGELLAAAQAVEA